MTAINKKSPMNNKVQSESKINAALFIEFLSFFKSADCEAKFLISLEASFLALYDGIFDFFHKGKAFFCEY